MDNQSVTGLSALPEFIVFSDLDGTLLDHETYQWNAARPALEFLAKRGIPLILASSKTAAEIAPLRRELGFEHCEAIVENGAGVLASNAQPDADGGRYSDLMQIIGEVREINDAPFSGFADWSDQRLSELTGLSIKDSYLAKQRQFSEPGLWSGDDDALAIFLSNLKKQGITARRGGRFLTLSFGGNKRDRMLEIIQKHTDGTRPPVSIALGDAPNDIEMLEAADLGIIISNPEHAGIPTLKGENEGSITRADKPGPEGWNASVLSAIEGAT